MSGAGAENGAERAKNRDRERSGERRSRKIMERERSEERRVVERERSEERAPLSAQNPLKPISSKRPTMQSVHPPHISSTSELRHSVNHQSPFSIQAFINHHSPTSKSNTSYTSAVLTTGQMGHWPGPPTNRGSRKTMERERSGGSESGNGAGFTKIIVER